MKDSGSEHLSEQLTNVEDALLARAYEIDDAEKLRKYIREKQKKPFYKTAGFRRASVIAASFFLIVGIWFSVPALFFRTNSKAPGDNKAPESTTGVRPVPPWNNAEAQDVQINSIDMLNYYTAMRVLAEGASPTAAVKPYGFTIISDIGYDKPLHGSVSESDEGSTEQDPSEEAEKIYYYKLDPNEKFSVTSVVFFQIEIKNKSGFLASKIGTGTADVVITENSLEPMITFKNGDRYYSCCLDSNLESGKLYSTHKYIEGFYIVKNMEQENYSFSVIYGNFNSDYKNVSAQSVICRSYQNGGSSPDGAMTVIGKTYISNEGGEFTVRDLEKYFSSGKLPEGGDSGSTAPPPVIGETEKADVYLGGGYVFELDPSGVFVYHGEESHYASYRKGTYTFLEDGVELLFYYEEELVEKAFCAYSGEDGFVYDGILYIVQKEMIPQASHLVA